MKKFLKYTLGLLGVVGLFGLSTSDASAMSFSVVIDKIEIVKDADNYPNTAVTVYEPRSGRGEAATRSIDLFNATQKLGTALTLEPAPAGTYESVVIQFSEIGVGSGSAQFDLLPVMRNAALGQNGANAVLILGDAGATGVSSLQTAFGTASHGVMAASAFSGVFQLPSLDFFLEQASVVNNGVGAITVNKTPDPIPVISQAVNSTTIPDLEVATDTSTAFSGVVTGFVNGASVVTVGLFDNAINPRPIMSKTFTAPSPAAVVQTVFADPPSTTTPLLPLAWIDANSNGRLDQAEEFTFHSATVATSDIDLSQQTVAAGANVSYTAVLDDLDAPAIQMGPRAITLTIDIADQDTDNANDAAIQNNAWAAKSAIRTTDNDMDVGAGGVNDEIATTSAAPATGTFVIIYAQAEQSVSGTVKQTSRTITLDAIWGSDNTATVGVINAAGNEAAYLGIATSASSTVANTSEVTSNSVADLLTITPIPLLTVTAFEDNANTGAYEVRMFAQANEGDNTVDLFNNAASLYLLNEAGAAAGELEDGDDVTMTVHVDQAGAEGGNDTNGVTALPNFDMAGNP